MVVVELQYSGRASPSTMEEEDVLEREREAPTGRDQITCYGQPQASLYIGEREEGAPPLGFPPLGGGSPRWERGGGQGEESLLPKAPRRCLTPLGLFPS